MDKRFLYEVRPLKQVVIPGRPAQRRAFTALLTINEVREYMKYGPVFRKYADPNIPMVQVTGANIYSLHQEYSSKKLINKPINKSIPIEKDEPIIVEESESKKFKEEESTSHIVETVSNEQTTPVVDTSLESDVDTNEITDIQENTNDGDMDVSEVVETEEAVVEESATDVESEPIVTEEKTNEGAGEQAEHEEATVEDTAVKSAENESNTDENIIDNQSTSYKNNNGKHNNNIQFSNSSKKHHK